MGGALASIASLSLKGKFPDKTLSLYTFGEQPKASSLQVSLLSVFVTGQPRTGNPDYAKLVETRIGMDNIFRCKPSACNDDRSSS